MKIKNIVLLAASNIKLALKSALAQFLLLCIFTAIVVLVLNVSAESFSKLFDSSMEMFSLLALEICALRPLGILEGFVRSIVVETSRRISFAPFICNAQ